ncbi:MAG: mycothiol conjugate amidase Mca [Homoserinimonas sp.]|jgi:mycothiol S-conjugate amidase|nr:mycothiol conjugate amidase Mca [Homoserinimonas sp.]
MTLRLLAVHAHPDDESSKGSATYAYYVSRGVEVMVVSCTGGERGDVLNDAVVERAMAERDMAGLRRIEMARAQAELGIQHRWLGFMDSGLPDEGDPLPANCFAQIPLEHSGPPLVKLVREFRPHVMLTYDENGGYPHPDHIRNHELAMHAFAAASDDTQYPAAGPAWQVSKIYYDRIFNSRRMKAMYQALLAEDPNSPLIQELADMRGWMAEQPYLATTQIPCGDFFEYRDRALRSHASQVSPDSRFFFWPNDLQRSAWPYEDYQLVSSLVSTIPGEADPLETDLFAGITDDLEPTL